MDLRRRMEILAESAVSDRDVAPRPHRPGRVGSRPLASVGIAAVRVPGGGTTSLMRVMQTNACSLSCGYCPTFCGGAVPRATITPRRRHVRSWTCTGRAWPRDCS
jgi:predicted DNA-binding helix-hairpin-helix protein